MNENIIQKAAAQFGKGIGTISSLGEGLIHLTYKVTYSDGNPVVLQCINQATFKQPENIINNYRLLESYLDSVHKKTIPSLCKTHNGKYYWIDLEENFWRATSFINNSYAPSLPKNEEDVYSAAKCFASFTQSLTGLPAEKLEVIIPRFHDLAFRYKRFEEAIQKAHINRLLKATHVISELRNRLHLVDFQKRVENNNIDFPVRIMHHDCKISNILFDKTNNKVLCPVDLDTVMPGKYYSDIGDMIRTMACTEKENSTAWENISVKPGFYTAIIRGYQDGMRENLTEVEKKNIHQPGLLLTYMQSLRFVADFLNNDIYYKTTYQEQNLNRALNQLIFLEQLENFTTAL